MLIPLRHQADQRQVGEAPGLNALRSAPAPLAEDRVGGVVLGDAPQGFGTGQSIGRQSVGVHHADDDATDAGAQDSAHVGNAVPKAGTAVPRSERKPNRRKIALDFVARGFRYACDHMPIKRLAGAIERTERAIRYWRNGEKEPGATDLLLAARACKNLRARIIAFLHIPESHLHRAEAEIDAMERQADAIAADAVRLLAPQAYEVGGVHRTRLSAIAAAARGVMRLRFRRRRAGTEALA